ncbi:DUF3618 domain-containing protein [Streptomyces sp. NBC_00669]|uniref:DUF3618 domain-containing protein n=1 Tax=Streptomyces sp. NBC_00669 TaxID=2976011 RepID=UPI002E328B53|nr:DUF3618 domain-containing protein [Streptomyces sp. NBC_00669]
MTPRTDPHLAELERQIAETREALGQTVEELAAKVDVTSRAKAKARDTAGRLRSAEDRTRTRAAQAASSVKSRLPGGSTGGPDSAAELSAGSGSHRAEIPAAPVSVPEAAPDAEAAAYPATGSAAGSATGSASGPASRSVSASAATAVSAVRSYAPAVAAATLSAAAAAALVWARHNDRT